MATCHGGTSNSRLWKILRPKGSCLPHTQVKHFFPLSVAGATCLGPQFLAASAASLAHVWVPFKDPLARPRGVILASLDPSHVRLCLITINTKIHPHTVPQNSKTKYYDVLIRLTIASRHLGRCTFISPN